MRNFTIPTLEKGISLIVLTTGPFGDPNFQEEVKKVALTNGSKVHLASGVVGGLDILATAKMMGKFETSFSCQRKSREGALTEFQGSCEGLYEKAPNHLNVAVTIALASNGMQETKAILQPSTGNMPPKFSTSVQGDFGKAEITTELGKQGPAMAAWSAVSLLDRLLSPITF